MEQFLAYRKYYISICYYISIKIQLGTLKSAGKVEIPPTLQSPESETTYKLSKGSKEGNINCNGPHWKHINTGYGQFHITGSGLPSA